MTLTFIYHSGFAVEVQSCILIFDYWQDPAQVVPRLLSTSKPIYVFSSHFHEDHFTREIFEWRKLKTDITYILSKDITRHRRADKSEANVWLAKGGSWCDSNINVRATGSNDSGVSWIVDVDGRRLFHAGDLGNWYARFLTDDFRGGEIYSWEFGMMIDPIKEEKRYLGELKDISKVATSFDVAFVPVDGRIGNGYTRGARQFIEQFGIGLFVPMHFTTSGFTSAHRVEEYTEEKGVKLWKIERDGEEVEV